MRLKKYNQFIKESIKEDIEEGTLWKLDEDNIREYLLELTDNGYLVTVTFGFVDNEKYYDYTTQKHNQKEVFTEKVLSGEKVRPAYWIQIIKGTNISNDDLTSTFQFACSIISEKANAEISIHDEDGNLGNPEGIVIKGGLFYTDDWNSPEPETLEVSGNYITIFAKQKDTVKISPKQLSEYYSWTVDLEKDGKIWIEIELEDLAGEMLSSRSEYKDVLIKGQEYMWDYYEMQYYEPDINSLFSYTLEKETKELLAKALIKEFGGFEEVKHWEKNSVTSAKDSFPQDFKSEEELVDYFVNERHNELFKKWIKTEFADSEVYREVTDTVANWEMSAHCDENYKEIIDEFDEIVEDELGKFIKVEREVTKYYFSNSERKEYKKEVTFFQFPYSNRWIENTDSDDLHGKNLYDIFKDWLSEERFNYTLNPRISDYGNADDKKMNQDIKSYLSRYLNRNS